MFNKKNDPLIESVKGVMEQNEIHRRVEAAVNEHFGIESRSALPHELHAEYDAVLAEAKKCSIEEGEVIDLAAKRKEKAKKKEEESDEGKIRKYVTALAGPKQAKKIMKRRDDDELNEEKKKEPKYKKNIHKQVGDKIKGYKENDDGKSITRQWTVERPKKKKKLEESEDKPDSPEHHRAMAIRAHKAMKAGDRSEITANKKKRHEKAYKEMTGSKIKYPDSMNEKVEMTKKQMANLDGKPEFTANDLAHLRAGTHKKKAAAGTLEEKAPPGAKYERMIKHIKKSEEDKPEEVKKRIAYATAWKAYGKKHGKTKEKLEEEMDIDLIMEEIRSNLLEELNYVYENYDEASFADYVNSLSEEQLEILGLNEWGISGSEGPAIKLFGGSKPDYSKAPDTSKMTVPGREYDGARAAEKSSTTHNPLPRKGGIFGIGSKEDTKGTGADTNAPSSIPRSTTAGDYKSGSGEKPSASHLAGGTKAPSSTTDTKPSILSPGAKPFTPPTPESARGLPSPTGASRFGKGGPGGARASSKATPAGARIAADVAKARGETPTPAAVSAAKNVRTGTPSTRPGAAKPAARPTARPGAARPTRPGATRPVRSGAPRTTAAQDFMNNFQREEYEKPQIKESFEQFLRNRFLKG